MISGTNNVNSNIITTWPTDQYFEIDLNCSDTFLEENNVKFLIGKDGGHFKYITRTSGVSFIWYEPNSRVIQIWGLENDIKQAFVLLRKRIEFVTESVVNRT